MRARSFLYKIPFKFRTFLRPIVSISPRHFSQQQKQKDQDDLASFASGHFTYNNSFYTQLPTTCHVPVFLCKYPPPPPPLPRPVPTSPWVSSVSSLRVSDTASKSLGVN